MDPKNPRRYKPPVDSDSDSELSDVPDDALLSKNTFQQNADDDDDVDAEGEEDEDAEGEDDEDAEGEEDDEVEEDESESEDGEQDAYEYSEEKESPSSAHSTPKPAPGRTTSRGIAKAIVPSQRGRAVAKSAPKRGRPPGRGKAAAAPASRASSTASAQPTIRLTLKMPKDRLRQATSGWNSGNTSSGESSRVTKGKPPPRSSRNTRKVIEPSTSEDEEEEEEDEDAPGEEDDDVEMSEADATGMQDDDTMMGHDMDDDLEEDDEEEEEEDAMGETDDEEAMPAGTGASGTSTPDLSKMTKRQRSRLNEVYSADLMELPSTGFGPSPANKLHLTADEQALRRAEMARRRRNLTVQKLEEEKMETINRLLNRQPPKKGRGTKTGDATPAMQGEDGEEEEGGSATDKQVDKVKDNLPPDGFVRWVSKKEGESLFVPDSWLNAPVGRLYGGPRIVMMEVDEGAREGVVA